MIQVRYIFYYGCHSPVDFLLGQTVMGLLGSVLLPCTSETFIKTEVEKALSALAEMLIRGGYGVL